MLPNRPWLIKHNPPELERSLIHQLWWEYHSLPKEARENNCEIILNTDAGTVCEFHPSVVMSRDLLSYEKKEMKRYGISLARLRLIVLRYLQTRSLRRTDGALFLTDYAARTVQETTGKLANFAVIPHGVGKAFKHMQPASERSWPEDRNAVIQCVYVSNALPYKHQWNVITAVGLLKGRGYNVSLLLVGGGSGRAQMLVEKELERVDPHGEFVKKLGFVSHDELPAILGDADIFVFASSCENMPNTLVEAMAVGLPIACSDKGPMPEILRNGGVYFDPEKPTSIATAIEKIIKNEGMRKSITKRAKELSEKFSWSKCASETWEYLHKTTIRHLN